MIRKVIISSKAQNSLVEIAGYIENKFSVNARIIFMKKFRDSVLIASENPKIFPLSLNDKKLHKCVVTKQTSFLYKFNPTKLEIISIFDTRHNPNKIKKDIK
mgnify:FL=1